MRIYRLQANMTQSGGRVLWFWSRKEAEKELGKFKRGIPIPGYPDGDQYQFGDIEPIDFEMNKEGVMGLLNLTPVYDNG